MKSWANPLAAGCLILIAWQEAGTSAVQGAPREHADAPETREFRFVYSATVTELAPGKTARVWAPIAPTNSDQEVTATKIETPSGHRLERETRFGNTILYFEGQANEQGEIPFRVEYQVTRRWLTPAGVIEESLTEGDFLSASKLVPVDGAITRRMFRDKAPVGTPREIARLLYDRVDDHMKYDKTGEGWGRGDVLWACDSKRGNCSDFHSLFISMAREASVPAKFEIGFPLPSDKREGEIAGYHCWAKFLDHDDTGAARWVGVDISEADKHPEKKELFFGNLPPDRVMFSTERDLVLSPRQAGGPVNFLVYPYVEVEGKPYAPQKRQFSFADVE